MRAPAAEPAPIPAIPAVESPALEEDAALEDISEGSGAFDVARVKTAVVCE